MPTIAAVQSGFPPHYYTQEQLTEFLGSLWAHSGSRLERLRQFHRNVQVEGRHLALPLEAYGHLENFGERNDAYIDCALELGERLACNILNTTGLSPQDVGLLATVSTTGLSVPTLDARLMNRIPFSRSMKRLPLFGLGCMGGAAGLARLADYLAGRPEEVVLLLGIELCSLTIQREDLSVANLISSGLFGDGGCAVLLAGDHHPLARGPRIVDSRSAFFPATEHVMGWDFQSSGFNVVLSADVVPVALEKLGPQVQAFLGEHGLTTSDIARWVAHPGGPKVIDAMEHGIGLPPGTLQLSRDSLAEKGNISSVSVLLILEKTLALEPPMPGQYGLLMAMGPAFSAELVLLQW